MSVTKRAALISLAGLIGYFLVFPGLALMTSGAHWDGNGARFEENTLGDTFFWLMMASFAVFVLASVVAVIGAIIRRVRPHASHV